MYSQEKHCWREVHSFQQHSRCLTHSLSQSILLHVGIATWLGQNRFLSYHFHLTIYHIILISSNYQQKGSTNHRSKLNFFFQFLLFATCFGLWESHHMQIKPYMKKHCLSTRVSFSWVSFELYFSMPILNCLMIVLQNSKHVHRNNSTGSVL